MVKKIYILFLSILFIFLSGCFLSNKKMNVSLATENDSKIKSELLKETYSYGEIIEIPIITKENIQGVSFDLELDKNSFELVNITKSNFSDENLVISYLKDKGYKIVAYDFKSNISAEKEILKIYLKVKNIGDKDIIIKNIKNKI